MLILIIAAVLVGATSGVLLVYRYPVIFPYLVVVYVGWFYTIGSDLKFTFGSINVYVWDILFALALLNLFIRLFLDGVKIERNVRWLVISLFLYISWLEFSEIFYFIAYDLGQSFDNLVRGSITSLYPLIGLSMALSLKTTTFSSFIKFVTLIAVLSALWMLIRQAFTIGDPFITSSGTARYGRGEMSVLLHIGLGILMFLRKLSPILRFAGIALLLIGIALLGHRSTFIGTGLLMLIFLFFIMRERVDLYKAIFLVPVGTFLSVIALAFILFSDIPAVENFRVRLIDTIDTQNETTAGRLQKWNIAWKSIQENPIGGTRLNGLSDWYGNHLVEAEFGRFGFAEAHGAYIYTLGQANPWPPHNVFINILSRNGVMGLLLFLMMLFASLRTFRFTDRRARICGIGIIMANLVFLTFNNHFQADTTIALFICLICLPFGLRLDESDEKKSAKRHLQGSYA